jgi:S1-C subfamily serine protease
MLNMVASLAPGKPAPMRLRRDGKSLDLRVDVGKRPSQTRRR